MNHGLSCNDAFWSVATQFAAIIISSLLVWAFWSLNISCSFIIGGLICVLPNIYLYRRVFAHAGAHAAQRILKALYRGEAIKLLLTACGFAGAASIPWILPLWLFAGYIVAQAGFWLAPIVLGCSRVKKNNQIVNLFGNTR